VQVVRARPHRTRNVWETRSARRRDVFSIVGPTPSPPIRWSGSRREISATRPTAGVGGARWRSAR